ncbi:MAG: ATP-binding protein [Acidimicrobiales bacterium]
MARRVLLAYVTLILVVLLLLEVPLGISYRDREVENLRARVRGDAVALASFAEDGLEAGGPASDRLRGIAEEYSETTGGRVVVTREDGQAILDTTSPEGDALRSFSSRPEIQDALSGRVATGTRRSRTLDDSFLYVAVPVASSGVVHGVVRVTFPTSAVDARVRRNWVTLGGVGLATLGVAALAAFALSRWVVRPLRKLEAATTALGQGALDTRTATNEGPPEVRRLAASVNETAARLEELVGSQEAFVADASHQLRTPLTALRLRLELLDASLGDIPDAADHRAGVGAALQEVARLSRLVDGLLTLARAERTGASATAATVDLGEALRERAAAWQPVADEEDVVLEVVGSAVARATADRLAQVVDNLLANAVEAAPPGSTVTLSTTVGPAGPELHVADRGPGLPDDERERAFDRFWSPQAGGRRLGGSGLGLAIVRKLVEADGGSVQLRSRAGGGIDATVVLPGAPAASVG